ncbi:phospholipid/cholesterol/gamma-HCH transport system permease protein [Nocardioides sp. J9]|uniref:MlaE family ABC transporter permease n=1 Tax=Nocardioides sp. J9 TaxID=935844 RepID=UPI0011A93E1C|nr:ABC transporter permease [Nocardioides sp. J9]TWG94928.1 phospholipid/cholesterol/gamma-HCH transport system permease protein [Nocardioides sp. J9]
MSTIAPKLTAARRAPGRALDSIGQHGLFYFRVFAGAPRALRRHPGEIVKLIAELGTGTGALALVGGSVVIITFITFFAGGVAAAQGFESSSNVGVGSVSPALAAIFTSRLSTPLLAGVALSVTLGAATTSQLGAMRISEEIDAIEVMAIPSLPYLASTRVLAGMIVITPLYVFATLGGFAANYLFLVFYYDVGTGNFSHYFFLYLHPLDIVFSYFQVLAMVTVVMLVHTFFGYTATGGPAGVGEAVGRSVRSSLSAVMIVNLLIAMAIYANFNTFHLAG